MRPLILLDIDGVLNPVACGGGPGDSPTLILSEGRAALVRRLAACGRIAWLSTWPVEQTAGLEAQLQLDAEPHRVPLPPVALSGSEAATPKLRTVKRWLARMELLGEAEWDSVVWIDDVLGPDAYEWARHQTQKVLLVKPTPARGLIEAHVVAVEVFVAAEEGG